MTFEGSVLAYFSAKNYDVNVCDEYYRKVLETIERNAETARKNGCRVKQNAELIINGYLLKEPIAGLSSRGLHLSGQEISRRSSLLNKLNIIIAASNIIVEDLDDREFSKSALKMDLNTIEQYAKALDGYYDRIRMMVKDLEKCVLFHIQEPEALEPYEEYPSKPGSAI